MPSYTNLSNGRHTMRLHGYNYGSSAVYHITICTHKRQPFFLDLELRTIIEQHWLALPERFPGVTLDEFIIMSDHIHALLWIDAKIRHAPTLITLLKSFKSLTTVIWIKHLRTTGQEKSGIIWQRNYFDRIICNEYQLTSTRQYIRNNPTSAKTPKI